MAVLSTEPEIKYVEFGDQLISHISFICNLKVLIHAQCSLLLFSESTESRKSGFFFFHIKITESIIFEIN